jgi:hypothetical protein
VGNALTLRQLPTSQARLGFIFDLFDREGSSHNLNFILKSMIHVTSTPCCSERRGGQQWL